MDSYGKGGGGKEGGGKPHVAEASEHVSWLCCVRCARASGQMARGLRSEKG